MAVMFSVHIENVVVPEFMGVEAIISETFLITLNIIYNIS